MEIASLFRAFSKTPAVSAAIFDNCDADPGPGNNKQNYPVITSAVIAAGNVTISHWHFGTHTTVNFLTLGTSGPVDVRVTKLSGPITHVGVSPHSKHSINSERRIS